MQIAKNKQSFDTTNRGTAMYRMTAVGWRRQKPAVFLVVWQKWYGWSSIYSQSLPSENKSFSKRRLKWHNTYKCTMAAVHWVVERERKNVTWSTCLIFILLNSSGNKDKRTHRPHTHTHITYHTTVKNYQKPIAEKQGEDEAFKEMNG